MPCFFKKILYCSSCALLVNMFCPWCRCVRAGLSFLCKPTGGNAATAIIKCTIGGCPGSVLSMPFCDTSTTLKAVLCVVNPILSCSGPWGKAIKAGLDIAMCAAGVSKTLSGGRRRRDESPAWLLDRARRDADRDIAAQALMHASEYVLWLLLSKFSNYSSSCSYAPPPFFLLLENNNSNNIS